MTSQVHTGEKVPGAAPGQPARFLFAASQVPGVAFSVAVLGLLLVLASLTPPHRLAEADGRGYYVRPGFAGLATHRYEFALQDITRIGETHTRLKHTTDLHLADGRTIAIDQRTRGAEDRAAHPSRFTLEEFIRLGNAGQSVSFYWYPAGNPWTRLVPGGFLLGAAGLGWAWYWCYRRPALTSGQRVDRTTGYPCP